MGGNANVGAAARDPGKGSEPMHVVSTTISDGIREQDFTLGGVPGVLWSPAGVSGGRPLVLLGHGGGSLGRARLDRGS